MMTFQELASQIAEILPEASVGVDFDGQLLIYTNLAFREGDDILVSLESQEAP